jgi:hypothetical protein
MAFISDLKHNCSSIFQVIALLLTLTILFTSIPATGSVNGSGYTHNVLNEHFVATYCPTCQSDEPNVKKAYNDLAGAFIIVSFHIAEWSTPEGDEMVAKYQVHTIPYHVFDGGYAFGKGRIISSNIQQNLKTVSTRSVHRIGLAIQKTIEGDTLHYEGSVQELDGKPFTGYVQVYVTENGLESNGREWGFVFRAFGIKKNLDMSSSEVIVFSGNWKISSNVKTQDIVVVAAAFDSSTNGQYGPYAVQAVNDTYSTEVIPELATPSQTILLAVLTMSVTVFLTRRSIRWG